MKPSINTEVVVIDQASPFSGYHGTIESLDGPNVKVRLFGIPISPDGGGYQYFTPAQLNGIVKTAVAFEA